MKKRLMDSKLLKLILSFAVLLSFVPMFTSTVEAVVTGDVNGDGDVNILDLMVIVQHMGETGNPGWIVSDLNSDGEINILDLTACVIQFGSVVTLGNLAGYGAYVIASDAPQSLKDAGNAARANGSNVWVCSNAADDKISGVLVNLAIKGGTLQLSAGTFAPFHYTQQTADLGIIIKGASNDATYISRNTNDTVIVNITKAYGTTNNYITLEDFCIEGSYKNGTGLYIDCPGGHRMGFGVFLNRISIEHNLGEGADIHDIAYGGISHCNFERGSSELNCNSLYLEYCDLTMDNIRLVGGYNGIRLDYCYMTTITGMEVSASEIAIYTFSCYNTIMRNVYSENDNLSYFIVDASSADSLYDGIILVQYAGTTAYAITTDSSVNPVFKNIRFNNPASIGTDIRVVNNNNQVSFEYVETLTPSKTTLSGTVNFLNCLGYVTQNSGTFMGNGSQQAISHGLSITPTAQQIVVSGNTSTPPYQSKSPDATYIYVTAPNNSAVYWSTSGY